MSHAGSHSLNADRLWLFDQQSRDVNLTALCAFCGGRFIVKNERIGEEIGCPMPGCNKWLKLNPFAVDIRDKFKMPWW